MIGLFDSGVGGLAVLRAVRMVLPDADLTYLADQANAPYGKKSLAEVRLCADLATARLIDRGADTIVIACTHYSFLDEVIQEACGSGVTVIDPAPAVARQVTRLVDGHGSGTTRYLTTADPIRFAHQVHRLLGETVSPERVS